jgi:hypothetical protein
MRFVSMKVLAAAVILLGTSIEAQALTINPATTPICGSPVCLAQSGNQTSQAQIDAFLASLGFPTNVLYKQDVGAGSDSGSFAGSYTTTFQPPADPSGAIITYDGAPDPVITANPVYLLVKDGSATPAWYFFNISGWNGTETITLVNFWPDQGAISHVQINGNGTSVPDGGSMAMLLGIALMGLAGARRMLQ